jgi:histidyl-tRNA synthetase
MGGPAVPGVGFAMGVERFLMEIEAQGAAIDEQKKVALYIANLSEDTGVEASKFAYALRRAGIGCETDLMGRSFRAQLKYANKAGIPYLAVLGADELAKGSVLVKRMSDGVEQEVSLNTIADGLTRFIKDTISCEEKSNG